MDWQPYPTTPEELSRAFMADAQRELEDAQVLRDNRRWAAAVTSSLHSVEKSLKGLLVIACGESEVPVTHRMLPIVEDRIAAFRQHLREDPARTALRKTLRLQECWVPGKNHAQNSEYPWCDLLSGELLLPGTEFQESHAHEAVDAAQEVLTVVKGFAQTAYAATL
jgi:HEPN domain-containing protein